MLLRRALLGVAIALVLRVLTWPQPPLEAWRWVPCRTLGVLCVPFTVSGTCNDERLRRQFARNFATMEEMAGGAMVAVVDGQDLVCELYGSRDGRVTRDTLQICFSTSKVVASLACAMLVDRGLIGYDVPIARYWPEFAAGGKENITVRELMQHRAGLAWACDRDPATDDTMPLFHEDAHDYMDRIARIVERSRPNYHESSRTGYHGLTRDLILNEIFRRVTNKTLGTFIQNEISKPLGVEFFVGLPRELEPRLVEMKGATIMYALGELLRLIGRGLFRRLPTKPQNIQGLIDEIALLGMESPLFKVSDAVGMPFYKVVDLHNTRVGRERESPSSNGVTNARALATIGAVLNGQITEPRIISEKGRREALKLENDLVFDFVTKTVVRFTACGIGYFGAKEWGEDLGGFYGWHGLGGQLFLFDGNRTSFAYLTASFGLSPPWEDVRSHRLLSALRASNKQ